MWQQPVRSSVCHPKHRVPVGVQQAPVVARNHEADAPRGRALTFHALHARSVLVAVASPVQQGVSRRPAQQAFSAVALARHQAIKHALDDPRPARLHAPPALAGILAKVVGRKPLRVGRLPESPAEARGRKPESMTDSA